LSQPALGLLKICYDVDKHLSLPSPFGYRLAIGYFRSGERKRDENFPSFRCKFGETQSVTLFLVFSTRSRLTLVDRPVGMTAASIQRGVRRSPGM